MALRQGSSSPCAFASCYSMTSKLRDDDLKTGHRGRGRCREASGSSPVRRKHLKHGDPRRRFVVTRWRCRSLATVLATDAQGLGGRGRHAPQFLDARPRVRRVSALPEHADSRARAAVGRGSRAGFDRRSGRVRSATIRRSSMMAGPAGCRCGNAWTSVRKASASVRASRRSSLAPAGEISVEEPVELLRIDGVDREVMLHQGS